LLQCYKQVTLSCHAPQAELNLQRTAMDLTAKQGAQPLYVAAGMELCRNHCQVDCMVENLKP
jgi:hypothetical protein